MGAGESSTEAVSAPETVQERSGWIRAQEIKKVAIRDYLKSIEKELPEGDKDVREHAAKILDDKEFKHFKQQFRFAGPKSLNFFVITGISEEFEDLESKVSSRFPRAEEVEGMKNEPYYVNTKEFNDRIYFNLGRFESNKWTDPSTGEPQRDLYPDECVAVVNKETDLMHVRTADVALCRDICKTIARSIGVDPQQEDVFYKPHFDQAFIVQFSEEVEKYINMTLHIEDSPDRTAGSVRFTSQKKEDGEYMDLRDDEQVKEELSEGDGNISRGYVALKEGSFSFELNRAQSKIWFRNYERENRINEIERLIDNVLKQSGGYPQQKLQGFGNISE